MHFHLTNATKSVLRVVARLLRVVGLTENNFLLLVSILHLLFLQPSFRRRQFPVLLPITDILGVENAVDHVADGLGDGVVVDFEVFEKVVVLRFGAKYISVHAVHPLEGAVELTIVSAFVEVKHFVRIEVRHLVVLIWLH